MPKVLTLVLTLGVGLLPFEAAMAQAVRTRTEIIPRVGTPGSNRLFGGAAGSPRQVQERADFGNSASSVFSTSGARASGSVESATGGLSGTAGNTGTGGLVGSTGAPTGGLGDLVGASTGGIADLGRGSAPTGGIRQASSIGFGIAGRSASGNGLLDGAGNSLTGGASVGTFADQNQ